VSLTSLFWHQICYRCEACGSEHTTRLKEK
jgi:hypothetical protein